MSNTNELQDLFVETTGQESVTESQEEQLDKVVEDGERGLPTTDATCPECGHDKAYWYMQQTRSADESETRFFVCVECDHKWREDDH